MNYIQNLMMSLKDGQGKLFVQLLFEGMLTFTIRLIIFGLILFIGSRIIKKIISSLDKIPYVEQDLSTKQFTKSIIKLGLYIIFFLIGLLAFGFSESSIATMISAIGLGVGISLKDFLSNIAGGVVIFFYKPFKVGNFIKVNGVMGEVFRIEVFSTHINSLDSKRIIIPNNVMISGNIINYDSNEVRRIKLMLSVSYSSDMKKVMSVLKNLASTYEGLDYSMENFINVMEYGDSSINILFMVWTKTEGYYKVRGELMSYIIELFTKENIDVPFNILDVTLTTPPK
ncbi:MAG: mechanosensitive ion channel [Cetobacterium sp.]|uniref:mechanosensitive ion channel family protein n=1 Tax=unclassified Cetobacterium TaxID=2630983 RepID=UPI00163CB0BC|nr:mechanosensitive ion channel domain-containing protein [Cetobacterium sp. 2A]MBC2856723.1 mechanosensitive ion channel [Cetobacterium sp. 2A]